MVLESSSFGDGVASYKGLLETRMNWAITMLSDKTALVTGGSRGIGAAIARGLAEAGARVAVNYVRAAAHADEVCRAIEEQGGTGFPVQADVGCVDDVNRMFDRVEAQYGPVDVLVNNAGIETRQSPLSFDEATYDRIMNTNLKGAFFCTQRALTGMKERRWGRVISISSVHEWQPTGFCAVYGMSKGGLAMMTRELALEFSQYGITLNNVSPGAIRTDINREVLADPGYEAKVIAKIPAGEIGTPEDVAKTVAFLVSDDARYITGTSIFIDGGLSL